MNFPGIVSSENVSKNIADVANTQSLTDARDMQAQMLRLQAFQELQQQQANADYGNYFRQAQQGNAPTPIDGQTPITPGSIPPPPVSLSGAKQLTPPEQLAYDTRLKEYEVEEANKRAKATAAYNNMYTWLKTASTQKQFDERLDKMRAGPVARTNPYLQEMLSYADGTEVVGRGEMKILVGALSDEGNALFKQWVAANKNLVDVGKLGPNTVIHFAQDNQGNPNKIIAVDYSKEEKQPKNTQILKASLPFEDGATAKKWVGSNKDRFASTYTYDDAMRIADKIAKMPPKDQQIYLESMELQQDTDGKIIAIGEKTKVAPGAVVKNYFSAPGDSEKKTRTDNLADIAIDQGFYPEASVKEKSGMAVDVHKKLGDMYGGDKKKIAEAMQILTENTKRGATIRRLKASADLAIDTIEGPLTTALNEWTSARDFAEDRKKLAGAPKTLFSKTQNEIEAWMQKQKLSPEALTYEAASFGAIRQINTAISPRAGAQKSLDLEHVFWSSAQSKEGLDKVKNSFLEEIKSAQRAFGVRPLPKIGSAIEATPDASKKEASQRFENWDKMVAEGAKATTVEGAKSWISRMKKAGWSADDVNKMERELTDSGKWRFK